MSCMLFDLTQKLSIIQSSISRIPLTYSFIVYRNALFHIEYHTQLLEEVNNSRDEFWDVFGNFLSLFLFMLGIFFNQIYCPLYISWLKRKIGYCNYSNDACTSSYSLQFLFSTSDLNLQSRYVYYGLSVVGLCKCDIFFYQIINNKTKNRNKEIREKWQCSLINQ